MMVREANEVVEVDMCNTNNLDNKLPKAHLKSLAGESVRTRVSELRQGRSLRFEFQSGRMLTVHLETFGMSVTLQVTGGDLGLTRLDWVVRWGVGGWIFLIWELLGT